ncbi:MAG: hypothetical protein QME21_04130 [Anaerolineales bacterium]|jgi:hypothetical protein|nr:hypothetical protein [Anaerolineales bacterium]
MNTLKTNTGAVAPVESWLYRLGGIASLAIGVAYIAIIGLYTSVGAPPVGGEAWLNYLVGKTAAWWAIVGISVLTNFLFVPVALSLYFALRHLNRIAILVGMAFVGLFVTLELAVNWAGYAALIMLSTDYATAANETQKMILVAAASYPSAVIASPLALVYAIGTLSFGFLMIGLVMLKGVFNKLTAFVGILTGILGIIAVAGVSIAVILNAVSATIWLFLVGYRLYQLAE